MSSLRSRSCSASCADRRPCATGRRCSRSGPRAGRPWTGELACSVITPLARRPGSIEPMPLRCYYRVARALMRASRTALTARRDRRSCQSRRSPGSPRHGGRTGRRWPVERGAARGGEHRGGDLEETLRSDADRLMSASRPLGASRGARHAGGDQRDRRPRASRPRASAPPIVRVEDLSRRRVDQSDPCGPWSCATSPPIRSTARATRCPPLASSFAEPSALA